MIKEGYTITITDLRKDTLRVLNKMEKSTLPFTIISNSKPIGVIMNMKLYEKTQQREPSVDMTLYGKGLDLFINPPKEFLIKKKGLNAVDLIRKDRDEWINL